MNVRRNVLLLLLCSALFVPALEAASPNVVISQVYGGGGNGGSQFRNDFIELYNRGTSAVCLNGWSVQYASAAGTSWAVTPLNGSLAPGSYYLVQEAAGAGILQPLLPTPNTTGIIAMSSTDGKVALVASTTPLSVVSPATCPATAGTVDLISYGTSTCAETSPTPKISNTTAAIRKSGNADTDNNAADFEIKPPAPRSSAPVSCGNVAPVINASANPIATVNQDAAPFNVGLTGSDDGGIYQWSATAGAGIASVSVAAGQSTSNVSYLVTLQAGFAGTASFTASLSDSVNPAVTRVVNVAVNGATPNNPPSIINPPNPATTVAQDAAPFTVAISGSDDNSIYQWSATAGIGVTTVAVGGGQGSANVTFTVSLQAGFSGTASITATLSDGVNTPANRVVNISVTPAPLPPLDHVVISQVYGGGGNGGATFRNDYVELYNPSTTTFDLGGWSIQYGSASGTTWQLQPLGGPIQPGEYYLISLGSNGAIGAALPAANVLGDLNLSGTSGKVALVNNLEALPSACPIGDATAGIVDLVGYGSPNCREGASNAPAPGNATAIFRKNGGFADTNVNGADFVTGTPAPRRTAPIVEIGPYVLTTDPRNNFASAPRDLSLTVTFTEPVVVDTAWFNISCAATGLHNDATIAGSARSWIITPNRTFQPGESCSVTIARNAVHDVDSDDSAPGTDTLKADYTFSFTIATGTSPAYDIDVHLTMGNPNGAVADTTTPNNYLMLKPEFALSYNRDRGIPNWVSWHLDDTWVGSLTRVDTFRPDPAVPSDWYRVTHIDYAGSGFDRGHMVPNADRDKETSMPINQATFLMSNILPQAPDNNQGPWANLENFLRTLLPFNEIYIVAGGAGNGGTGSNGAATIMTLANGKIAVPAQTWKVALVIPKQSGNDVTRVSGSSRTISVLMPNTQGIRTTNQNDWMNFLTTVDQIEALTGYDFFSNVADAVENSIEAGTNGTNPPGVANQSVSTTEDTARTFTLDAVSANGGPLTYTILTQPSHGSLSGSGSNQTFTPAPDFNGADTFTYQVSEGAARSNVGTVTVTILEANDVPSAGSDSASTNEDQFLQLAVTALTLNDTAGPANESAQTLTVTRVFSTANTNGTVVLSNGQVTYTSTPNFNGPASFQYEVCDNGVTAGLTASLCATATVSVNVAPVNDAPTISIQLPVSTSEGSSVTATASVADIDMSDTLSISWTVSRNGVSYGTGNGAGFTFTPDDNGAYLVTATVSDGSASASAAGTVAVANQAPLITTLSGPTSALALGSIATLRLTYTDAGAADTHTATFLWDDGSNASVTCSGGLCTASRTYQAAGTYGVEVRLTDDDGATVTVRYDYIIVVDPNGGSVTGGGFFDSPAGALVPDPGFSGRISFGFTARYQRNQLVPEGNTTIQFHGAGLDFHSSTYEWLVVSGAKAQYKGTMTSDSVAYGFLLTLEDGKVKGAKNADRIRLKIWNQASGVTVYDNVPGASDDLDASPMQAVGGGSVNVHSGK